MYKEVKMTTNRNESQTTSARSQRLNLRTTVIQDNLIRAAAESQNKSVSDFVLESATAAAANAVLDKRVFFLDDEAWEEMNAILDRPAVFKPQLAKLLAESKV
jgi:uncharacterized protein (DUF1778 family)